MNTSARTLRKRFLTKEERIAYQKIQEKKQQEARVKALRESRLQKAKAKKERELKKNRARLKLETNMTKCEPGFRHLVQQWAKGRTTAKINRFFQMLAEVHCPMEPCYNHKLLTPVQKVLRLNKCGYRELCMDLNLPDNISDFWNKEYQRQYDNAHELDSILYDMSYYK